MLRIALDDPEAATVALAPVISGSAPLVHAHLWDVQAFLLEAITRDALGDVGAARRALERALHLAKPESLLFPFLFDLFRVREVQDDSGYLSPSDWVERGVFDLGGHSGWVGLSLGAADGVASHLWLSRP